MISFLRRLFPPRAIRTGHRSMSELRIILDVPNVRLLDRNYTGVSVDSFMKFAEFNTISNRKYVPETHDCDDFAFAFFVAARKWAPGIPVGIVLGNTIRDTPHAWNCFIDVHNREVYYFEPQEDTLFQPTSEKPWEIII